MTNPEMPEDDRVHYAGEAVIQPVQRWTDAEKLALLDWHPLFTGRCPQREMPIAFGELLEQGTPLTEVAEATGLAIAEVEALNQT